MKRTELYALVWAKPMMHVAQELGMSGPGLAKLCDRNGIPTPHRGHWAKLRAGKRSKQEPLPQPSLDVTVGLPTAAQRQRRDETKAFNQQIRAGRTSATAPEAPTQGATPPADLPAAASAVAALKVAEALDRPHALVRATAVVVQQLPAQLARFERATPAQRASASFKIPPLGWRQLPCPACCLTKECYSLMATGIRFPSLLSMAVGMSSKAAAVGNLVAQRPCCPRVLPLRRRRIDDMSIACRARSARPSWL